MTDTQGLSRREHVLSRIEHGQWLTTEERGWALKLLTPAELDLYASQVSAQPPDFPIPIRPAAWEQE